MIGKAATIVAGHQHAAGLVALHRSARAHVLTLQAAHQLVAPLTEEILLQLGVALLGLLLVVERAADADQQIAGFPLVRACAERRLAC